MPLSNTSIIVQTVAAVMGAGGLGAYVFRRITKGSQFDYITEWSKQFNAREQEWSKRFQLQTDRIDSINHELGVMKGRLQQSLENNSALIAENMALRSEVDRLRTALRTEADKATALAAKNV